LLKLQVIIGSTRPERAAERVAPWVVQRARAHREFDVEVLDLRDWPLPMFSENRQTLGDPADPTYSTPVVRRWNRKIAEGDAYLFITPEYTHSVPGVLKNAIDSVFASFAFRNKPAGFVGYSSGIGAGIRAVEHLAMIAIEAEMVPLRNTVLVAQVAGAFNDRGTPTNPMTEAATGILLEDLAWWTRVLQRARAEGQLPPATVRLMAARPQS
jgi:NAD(P)H-dependent FMN reductase